MKLIKPKKIRKCDRKLIRYEYTVLFRNRELFYLFTTFGFWTSLLTPRYSQASFQSKIIKTCFKGVPLVIKDCCSYYGMEDSRTCGQIIKFTADKWKVDSVEELLKTCKTNIRTFNE